MSKINQSKVSAALQKFYKGKLVNVGGTWMDACSVSELDVGPLGNVENDGGHPESFVRCKAEKVGEAVNHIEYVTNNMQDVAELIATDEGLLGGFMVHLMSQLTPSAVEDVVSYTESLIRPADGDDSEDDHYTREGEANSEAWDKIRAFMDRFDSSRRSGSLARLAA
jgi:hypothetical protein